MTSDIPLNDILAAKAHLEAAESHLAGEALTLLDEAKAKLDAIVVILGESAGE